MMTKLTIIIIIIIMMTKLTIIIMNDYPLVVNA